jgi:hypothetical protein
MEKCSRCGAPTQLFISGTPVCTACVRRENPPVVTPTKNSQIDEPHSPKRVVDAGEVQATRI